MKYTGRSYIVVEKSPTHGNGVVVGIPLKEIDEYGHFYLEVPLYGRLFSPRNPQSTWHLTCKIREISFDVYLKALENG